MKRSVVFIYNSFKDPLFQGNLFQQLLLESKNCRFKFHLITFEQKEYQLSAEEEVATKRKLRTKNIFWTPLKWHSGRFIILKKLYDLINSLLLIVKIHIKHKPSSIISLGTIAGGYCYIIKSIFFYKHYAYQFEPHSEFMADFNIWNKTSIKYKVLNKLEALTSKNAEIISTGTHYMKDRLHNMKVAADIFYLPSCINEEYFPLSAKKRIEIRDRYNIASNQKVLIYLGKFGGIYYDKEIFNLMEEIYLSINDIFIFILTPNNHLAINAELRNRKINNFHVTKAEYRSVYEFLNAADVGISAIPGFPSQKYRSPIKIGEYLLCGLPYITCSGVSEDDIIAEKYHCGVVLENYERSEIKNSMNQIKALFSHQDKSRLREIGISYRGLSMHSKTVISIFKKLNEIS
jgi:hypothetical protein